MACFKDLSDYTYANSAFGRPPTKAIGWLGFGHEFSTAEPSVELLDLLSEYCSVSIALMRGGHDCEFCPTGTARLARRKGYALLLGVSEIRVFSRDGQIYAAPTLIYHYVADHHYKPPNEFLQALREGPQPPSKEYLDMLTALGLEWSLATRR
jgi:hypothetical protein